MPGSHRPTDTAATVDARALEQAIEFGLMLTDALDAALAAAHAGGSAARA